MTTKEAGTKAKTAETSKKASASSAKGAPLTEAELLKMSDKDYMSAAQFRVLSYQIADPQRRYSEARKRDNRALA